MSKHNDPIVSLPSKSPDSPITVLLSNLRLLDLDKRDDWPVLSAHIFTAKDSPQNQRSRIRCVEWICYCLYQIWDRGECQRVSEEIGNMMKHELKGVIEIATFFPAS